MKFFALIVVAFIIHIMVNTVIISIIRIIWVLKTVTCKEDLERDVTVTDMLYELFEAFMGY